MRRRFAGLSSKWIAPTLGALLLVGMVAVTAGCDSAIGDVQELVIDEPLLSGGVIDVELSLERGSLTVAPGAAGLVSGTVHYNVDSWKPDISRDDDGLSIRQGSKRLPEGDTAAIVNEWSLLLGETPMRLNVEMGAAQGSFDLGGLSLLGLELSQAAAETQVDFSAPNPSQLDRFRYEAAASTVTLDHLANANAAKLEFDGTAGTYTLDFSGGLRSDTVAEITVSAGTLLIEVPSGTRARVKMKGTAVDLVAQGSWTIEGSTYSTPALVDDDGGRTLTIELQMTGGSATLMCE